MENNMRSSGVLMHLSSLPSPYGIGTMGQAAREFIDFLAESGQTYWQILPICPTGFGDSPYQSFSTFAGNPYFIDLDGLYEIGILEKADYETVSWGSAPDQADYGVLYEKRYPVLKKAAEVFLQAPSDSFRAFCEKEAFWLEDYGLFMALKNAFGGASWLQWPEELKNRKPQAMEEAKRQYAGEILFWKVLQFFFFSQWKELKAYAGEKGISIIGDCPIYVALDSVDVWANPENFQLDENRYPKDVAGCPPDGFSADGQLWGNPLYDWEKMERDGFSWWICRIQYLCQVYDVLRIDHFRGFDTYYAIPYGSENAAPGRWKQGPGMELFHALERAAGRQRIIAEDLGFMTDSVRQLLKDSGFPGMKVLEFAFDTRDKNNAEYFPHTYKPSCVAYIGTHDNDTVQGWMQSAAPEDVALAKEYLRLAEPENYHWEMMQALWASVADLTIVQAQDLLGLGSESRMNTPSTTGNNWCWRALPGSFTKELADRLRHLTKLYGRGHNN